MLRPCFEEPPSSLQVAFEFDIMVLQTSDSVARTGSALPAASQVFQIFTKKGVQQLTLARQNQVVLPKKGQEAINGSVVSLLGRRLHGKVL